MCVSVRNGSFFEHFNLSLIEIFQILIRYGTRCPRYSFIEYFGASKNTVLKIIRKLILLMPPPNFVNNKLGGQGQIVQVDETMLNYKCKSHRGRSPTNRTDALCIIECGEHVNRVFACVIPDKRQETILPIICQHVASNTSKWTDEHRSYSNLNKLEYLHNTVCHKYCFIDHITGVNTQAVKSFNNILKMEIKARKGIKTKDRKLFLNVICYKYNNKDDLLVAILDLIKLN